MRATLSVALIGALSLPLAAQQLAEFDSAHVPEGRIEPWGIAAGDLDGDGDLDLVVVQQPRQQFDSADHVWLNDGHARFRDHQALPGSANEFTYAIELADVDGDGDLDLVTFGTTTKLWINDGQATFRDQSAALLPPEGQQNGQVGVLADFDHDGDPDLVRLGVHTDAYLENDGRGRFTFRDVLPFPRSRSGARNPPFYPTSVVDGDFDGDGNRDLLVGSGEFALFAGDGRGNFTELAHGIPAPGAIAQGLAALDIDGDGDLDALAGLWGNPVLQPVRTMVLANNGNGTFVETTATALPNGYASHRIAVADLDGDGVLDVVIAREEAPVVAVGDGRGGFAVAPPAAQPAASESTVGLVAADLDGDGLVDLACASVRRGPGPSYWGRVELYANLGSGELALLNPPRLPRFPTYTAAAALVDVDRDGDLDLWRATVSDRPLLINDGNGYFAAATIRRMPLPPLPVTAAIPGDYDGDGDLDAFAALSDGERYLVENDGSGNFAVLALPPSTALIEAAAFVDVDGDGDLDLVQGAGNQPELWLGDGRGGFTLAPGRLPAVVRTRDIEAGDLDGDGDPDLVLSNAIPIGPSMVRVLLNDGGGRFTEPTPLPIAVPGLAYDCVLFDRDGDGDLDVLVVGGAALQLFDNDGRGRFTDVSATALPVVLGVNVGAAVVDLDADGAVEILVARFDDTVVLRRQGAGFVRASGLLPADTFGACFAVGDVDRDGDLDVYFGRNRSGQGIPDLLYLNRDRQLHAPAAARLGRPWLLRLDRSAGGAIGAPAALPCLSTFPLTPRLALPPYGELGIDPVPGVCLPLVAIPATTGTVTLTVPLPRSPVLHGLPLAAQALIATPALPGGWRLTGISSQTLLR